MRVFCSLVFRRNYTSAVNSYRTSIRKVGKLTFLFFLFLCWSQFALSLSKPAEEEVSDLVLRVSKPLDTEHQEQSGKNQKGLLKVLER